MRKLPILTAVKHALNSVVAFRGIGIRIGLAWMLIFVALNFIGEFLIGGPAEPQPGRVGFFVLVQFAVSVMALSSIAVSWNRFVLRDELPPASGGLRLDGLVWRYAGTYLLIGLLTLLPAVLFAAILFAFVPQAAILALPAVAAAITANFILSLKLPAVALGRTDFNLTDAMKACEGNFWQIMGVVLLASLIAFALYLALLIVVALSSLLPRAVGVVIELPAAVAANLFIILFGTSILTSLYGFFVERRDF